jgi:hypothetical protein
VRDRRDADVHVLVTQQGTAAGGSEITLAFLGLRAFAARSYTLRHVSDGTNTFEEVRAGVTRVLQLGLGPYLADTPAARRITTTYAEAPGATTAGPADDPWDFWVFRLSANGSMSAESQERFWSGNTSVSANRTTDRLKLAVSARANGSRAAYDVVDTTAGVDTTYVSTHTYYQLEGVAAWSLGAHWSAGFLGEVERASSTNFDLAIRGGPAIEFDVFPYSASTRQLLTIRYVAGLAIHDYADTTIYDRTSEIRPVHVLELDLDVQEPWGSLNAGLDGLQYLHDLSKHSLGVSGGVSFRVFRGFDFNFGGSVSRIEDQLYLAKAGLTPEEVLLQLRARQTEFRFGIRMGLSYRFGSRFANVVNPRLS